MMTILQTLSATLPVIFLVLVGILIRLGHVLKAETIEDLKHLVVKVTLPLLLFRAFAGMTFEVHYVVIVVSVFLACCLVMFMSARFPAVPGLNSRFSSFLMAGFEAGMLGYALFSSMYGDANIGRFAVIDLGQVLFVFFILIPRLEWMHAERIDWRHTLLNFIKTPVIIGIFAGILANLSGLYSLSIGNDLFSSFFRTIEILAGLTTPLVAIVIGYQLNFHAGKLIPAFQTVLLRLAVWVLLALGFNALVIRNGLGLDRTFEAAVLLMAVLPAPFVIPFYLNEDDLVERDTILNVLSIGTILALVGGILIRITLH
jgi:predicted permease